MDIPALTREYTPGSCSNSRKPMRLPTRHEMRPDSPALHAHRKARTELADADAKAVFFPSLVVMVCIIKRG